MFKNYAYVFVFLILTFSCETELDVDIVNENPKLVINSLFNPDSIWSIDLSRNGNILDGNPTFPPVKDAVVTIFDENNQAIETLTYSPIKNPQQFSPVEFGVYKGKTKPLSDKHYTIRADVNNEVGAHAVGHAPNPVKINVLEVDSSHLQSDGKVQIKIAFIDPADKTNYYQIKVLVKIKTIQLPSPSNGLKDTLINTYDAEVQFETVDETPIISGSDILFDAFFNGKMKTLQLRMYPINNSYSNPYFHREYYDYRVVLMNISEEYYKYYSTIRLYNDTRGNPLAQPVQIFSNIENGFGIFAGYGASKVQIK